MDLTVETGDPPQDSAESVRYWLNEIASARKREKKFRSDGQRILEIYAAKKDNKTPFNILFSNTETLLPALYSAVPRPIVQRRFKDDDPLGRAAAMAGQRMLEFLVDTNVEGYETFDEGVRAATLDALLPGRGVTCLKYDADIAEVTESVDEQTPAGEQAARAASETTPYLRSELVCLDTRSWNRVFFGYAKKWSKVPWVAFEEQIDQKEATRLFGAAVARTLTYTDEERLRERDDDTDHEQSERGTGREEVDQGQRKTTLIYQIWDKAGGKKIRYLASQTRDSFLKVEDDPLQLTGFFNCPRPLQFVEKSNDLQPTALYLLYENQAKELNRLTNRLQKIVEAIKARGVYAGDVSTELSNLMKGDDNELVPAESTSSLAFEKGLQNAIWMMPLQDLIIVAEKLYAAREQCKRVIYEITGISDIIRGSTVASETATAQQIKTQWGTLRLKRLQKEVQRYARDLLRMMLEIAATKFSEETWARMTGLPFLSTPQTQQLQTIATAAQQQAVANPQDPQTAAQLQQIQAQLQMPQWAQVLKILQDDVQRVYRIDIETNSTLEPEAAEDHQEISEMMTAMGQFLNGVAPLVAKGVMPFQTAQAMMLAISRRFRFGTEVEDYIKQMQAPKPEADQSAATAQIEQAKMQIETQRLQGEAQQRQAELQTQQAIETAKHQRAQAELQAKGQIEAATLQTQKEIELAKVEGARQTTLLELQAEQRIEQMKAKSDQDTELKKAALQGAVQIEIARINAQKASTEGQIAHVESADEAARNVQMMEQIMATQEKLLLAILAPKTVERDPMGRAMRLVPQMPA